MSEKKDVARKEAWNGLKALGMSGGEIAELKKKSRSDLTEALIGAYDPGLAGAALGGLLRAIRALGEPEMAADFYIRVIKGPPVPAQLLVLQSAAREEFKRFDRLQDALAEYLGEFDNLTQAYSCYEDRYNCGCKGRCAL